MARVTVIDNGNLSMAPHTTLAADPAHARSSDEERREQQRALLTEERRLRRQHAAGEWIERAPVDIVEQLERRRALRPISLPLNAVDERDWGSGNQLHLPNAKVSLWQRSAADSTRHSHSSVKQRERLTDEHVVIGIDSGTRKVQEVAYLRALPTPGGQLVW